MKTHTDAHAEQPVSSGLDYEAMLQSEIEFWEEMIRTCPATQPSESLERMRQALALAQTRLERVSRVSILTPFPTRRDQ